LEEERRKHRHVQHGHVGVRFVGLNVRMPVRFVRSRREYALVGARVDRDGLDLRRSSPNSLAFAAVTGSSTKG
jgi:hypothetical protein